MEPPTQPHYLADRQSTDPPLLAEIVLDRPMNQPYTYIVPEALASAIEVGKRVEVPFGRGDKRETGYVIRVLRDHPIREVKSIERVVDNEALLTESLLKITRWMADYYVCGWGQVLQAVLPAGVRSQAGIKKNVHVESIPESELPNPLPELTKKQRNIVDLLRSECRDYEIKEFARIASCGVPMLQNLIKLGMIHRTLKEAEKVDYDFGEEAVAPKAIVMNPDQEKVWARIRENLTAGGFKAMLLHGVTGSGKTEIYLQAIQHVLDSGKEVIVLVPEISLTPQTIQRFRGRCGNVAVMHSHLTDSERGAHWRKIAGGGVQVVVGARSAVFAPTRQLGMIIIDEEHESSFKQESTPRYHARDVAVMRAKLENVPILLGSATPALESWNNAQRGNYELLSLPNRVMDLPMPKVKIIDLRHEPKSKGKHFAISPTLEEAMRKALTAGGQVMLFLNRRGFSTHIHCPGCGYVANCQHCDLALTFHQQRSTLLCHYCGYEQAPLNECPSCKQPSVRYQGLGTEKLQAEIEEKFPSKVVQRMDSDTMTRPGSHQVVLDAFREGGIHILIGTQMIAKGLDFPNVTLVGVINADASLHLPDFRAAERTFQLLAQVAGRSGRGDKGGSVLIQTYTPEHPSIRLATQHDFIQFATLELKHRLEHSYPPYFRLARIVIRSLKQDSAEKHATHLSLAFKRVLENPQVRQPGSKFRILGPAEAPIFKLNDQYRYHFQIQSDSSQYLHQVLHHALALVKPTSGVEVQIDIDPQSML
jgi:primosomal protein N' (replication factor Y)